MYKVKIVLWTSNQKPSAEKQIAKFGKAIEIRQRLTVGLIAYCKYAENHRKRRK